MKTILIFLAAFGFSSLAQAAHQYIQCAPKDRPESGDRVVVALFTANEGTIFMSSDMEKDENSGVIALKKSSTTSSGQWLFVGENTVATFTVTFPGASFWRRSDDLELEIALERKDGQVNYYETLNCYSRVYE